MGLMTTGEPLDWEETKKHSQLVKRKGIEQFIKLYKTFKSRQNDPFKYGDEVEYNLIKFDHTNKRVYLLLKAHELMPILVNKHNNNNKSETSWTPEFGDYMLEGLPGLPYEQDLLSIQNIEANMNLRRNQLQSELKISNDEHVITCTTFPLLGCSNFTWPNDQSNQSNFEEDRFFPNNAIFQGHPRYAISFMNNRARRQAPTFINIPIFIDKNTPQPFYDCENKIYDHLKENHVYLEGIGASCSCLQVTFQGSDLDQARLLYDQLTPLTPILLALSAASPIWRGYLCDIDCRWKVISASLDDRTPEEKGEQPLKNDKYRIFKSRYDSVDCYLSPMGANLNDLNIVKDEDFYDYLLRQDIDHLLAQHISHLFIRDPLVLYRESLNNTEIDQTDHFENIQSTNWQSMRFKPPPNCNKNSKVGWRVEFRTTELQLSDFENAAFVTFLVLITKCIIKLGANFLIPISLVDENMTRAQRRGACLNQNFFFTSSLFYSNNEIIQRTNSIREMKIDEIINGSNSYKGIIPLIRDNLTLICDYDLDQITRQKIDTYLKLIEMKANGSLMTTASYMRHFVQTHPKYKFDSRVNQDVAYDLMWHLNQISSGQLKPELLNNIVN